ncbi:hypothetical protein F3Y22_tig00012634pilonHSYRG00003 [Hibiscus syriacus]|uniref:Uncharacterized protein n=1 Tax=Hibiscus syriacus TaxID=106335 RepID=A0A6A3C835_HIBSY|nr:hypothetical protein F3Y22_tig00012634pilonHSYRG00003 [Hibiscus syriacus]
MSTSSSTSTGGSGKSAPIIREFVKVQVGGNARGQSHPIRFRLVSYYILAKELDEFDSFYKKSTEGLGYSGIYIQRSGQKRDGCGIFYNKNRAELLLEEMVEYNVLVPPIHDEASSSDKRKAPPTNRNNRGDPMQVILCGDFNSTPGDEVYRYLISGNTLPASSDRRLEERPLVQRLCFR